MVLRSAQCPRPLDQTVTMVAVDGAPRSSHISAQTIGIKGVEYRLWGSLRLPPTTGGDTRDERAGNVALARDGSGDRYRGRLRTLRPRHGRAEQPGPAERTAGLLAEPRRAHEDPGSVAGDSREGQDGDLHRRRLRSAGRHRTALQGARRVLRGGNRYAHGQRGR